MKNPKKPSPGKRRPKQDNSILCIILASVFGLLIYLNPNFNFLNWITSIFLTMLIKELVDLINRKEKIE